MKNLLDTLNNARECILLVEPPEGKIRFANLSSKQLFGMKDSNQYFLKDFLANQDVSRCLSLKSIEIFKTKLKAQGGSSVEQCVISMEISSGDLGEQARLLMFGSFGDAIPSSKYEDDFLATLTHDLKNPLGAVFGYTDVLLDTAAGTGLNQQQRDIIGKIRITAARTIELVRNHQHLSQIESTGVGRSTTKSDLNQAVQAVIDYTWREDTKSPTVVTKLSEERLLVPVDRILLERVVSNLLSNAIKYSPKDKTVTVSTERLDNNISLAVHNFGDPIPQDEIPKLFDRFYRGSTSEGIPGSGLGLYIIKYILDGVGGSTSVTSSAASGTTFSVKFPGVRG